MREKIEKEYERLVKEEKTYPKNSFKLEEEDRVTILGKLYETQKHLIKILKQFPVSINVSSFSLQNKKSIIDRKIAEVDKIVKIFEMKKVFLKK